MPVTVRHADCDLTGVLVTYRDYGGTHISATPGFVTMSSGLVVTVARRTLDVSIDAPKISPGEG